MSIVIHRCIKRPGLIDRARTYYIEFNEKGLYVICLGNATQEIPRSTHVAAHAIATHAVKFITNQYEKKIQETELRIQSEGVEQVVKDKHSFFLSRSEIDNFEYTPLADHSVRIKIKGGKLNIHLFADIYYERLAAIIKEELKK